MALGDLRTLILLLSCASSCHGKIQGPGPDGLPVPDIDDIIDEIDVGDRLNETIPDAGKSGYRIISMVRDLADFDHLPTLTSSVGVALSHLRASWRYSFNLYAWKRSFTEAERKGGHPIFQTIRYIRAALGAYPNRDVRKRGGLWTKLLQEDLETKAELYYQTLNGKVQSGGNNLFLSITMYAILANLANFFWFRAKEATETADDVLIAMATGTPLVEQDLKVAPELAPIALEETTLEETTPTTIEEKQAAEDTERKQADLKWVTWLQPLPLWFKVSWLNLVSAILQCVRFGMAVNSMRKKEVHFLGRTMWERFLSSAIDYMAWPIFLINIYKWEQPFMLKDLLGLAITNSGVFMET